MHELMTGGLFSPDVYKKTDCRTLRDICQFISEYISPNPMCVETGTTYQFLASALQHHTTNNILKYIAQPLNGHLYTIDIEDRSEIVSLLNKADNIMPLDLPNLLLPCVVFKGESVECIRSIVNDGLQIDLLCLDSSEDAQHMVDEYLAAEPALAEKHYLLIDDIHNPGSVKYLDMVPLIKEKGYDWVQVPTPVGMMVAAKGYPVPRKEL